MSGAHKCLTVQWPSSTPEGDAWREGAGTESEAGERGAPVSGLSRVIGPSWRIKSRCVNFCAAVHFARRAVKNAEQVVESVCGVLASEFCHRTVCFFIRRRRRRREEGRGVTCFKLSAVTRGRWPGIEFQTKRAD